MPRHDMHLLKQDAKSEQIRLSNGWLRPEEIAEQQAAEERHRLEQARKATRGNALFDVETT